MELSGFAVAIFNLVNRSDHIFVVTVDMHGSVGDGRGMHHRHDFRPLDRLRFSCDGRTVVLFGVFGEMDSITRPLCPSVEGS